MAAGPQGESCPAAESPPHRHAMCPQGARLTPTPLGPLRCVRTEPRVLVSKVTPPNRWPRRKPRGLLAGPCRAAEKGGFGELSPCAVAIQAPGHKCGSCIPEEQWPLRAIGDVCVWKVLPQGSQAQAPQPLPFPPVGPGPLAP